MSAAPGLSQEYLSLLAVRRSGSARRTPCGYAPVTAPQQQDRAGFRARRIPEDVDVSQSAQSIWKPLFWLVLATLIAVYLLYNDHSNQLQDKLVATTQSRAELEQLLATTSEGSSARETASDSESKAGRAGPSPEQTALQARIEQLEADLAAIAAERDQLAARDKGQQSTSADDETQIAEAKAALDAMRRKLQQQEQALESAREQRAILCEQRAEQASAQVHDLYERFAPLGARLTDRGLLVNLSDQGIRFPSGSAVLPDNAEPALSQLAEILVDHPELRVQIEGHTDSTGSAEINLELSEQRAAAVRDVLMEREVNAERLRVQGLGSKQPIADNATEAGRERNRRVEIHLVREDNS